MYAKPLSYTLDSKGLEKIQDRSLFYASLFVLTTHFIFILLSIFYYDPLVKKLEKPLHTHLVVKTIQLNEHKKSALRKEEPISLPTPEPVIEHEIEEEEVEEIQEKPKVEKTLPKKESIKKIVPKKEVKKSAKPKKIEKKKTEVKKETKKPLIKKKETVKKKETPKVEKPKVDVQENLRKEKLLKSASQAIAQIDASRKKLENVKQSVDAITTAPAQIGKLMAETSSALMETLNSSEQSYYSELASRLKLLLRLPEFGEVKVKLTLLKQGKFSKVLIVSSASQANKKYVEKTLPTLSYPAFGSNFKDLTEYTFVIVLSNEL